VTEINGERQRDRKTGVQRSAHIKADRQRETNIDTDLQFDRRT
jgi:hypothetical protein